MGSPIGYPQNRTNPSHKQETDSDDRQRIRMLRCGVNERRGTGKNSEVTREGKLAPLGKETPILVGLLVNLPTGVFHGRLHLTDPENLIIAGAGRPRIPQNERGF